MQVADNVPEQIFQDETRLGQIIVNIISNAVKFTFKGTVSTLVEMVPGSNDLRVVIKDTGKGIERLNKIGHLFGNLDVVDNVN